MQSVEAEQLLLWTAGYLRLSHDCLHVLQVYFGLSLSLQNMAGPVQLNQAMGFAIEALGCGITMPVMMRFGCRVTVAYSMLQGEFTHLTL